MEIPRTSSYIISHYIQGDFIEYGNGTSCLADLYFDGGGLMIIIGMLCWGFFVKYSEMKILNNSHISLLSLCVSFYFLIHVVYIPRSVILAPLKYAIWLYVIVWLYNAINRRYSKI